MNQSKYDEEELTLCNAYLHLLFETTLVREIVMLELIDNCLSIKIQRVGPKIMKCTRLIFFFSSPSLLISF